jgi:hypothetical protein
MFDPRTLNGERISALLSRGKNFFYDNGFYMYIKKTAGTRVA